MSLLLEDTRAQELAEEVKDVASKATIEANQDFLDLNREDRNELHLRIASMLLSHPSLMWRVIRSLEETGPTSYVRSTFAYTVARSLLKTLFGR